MSNNKQLAHGSTLRGVLLASSADEGSIRDITSSKVWREENPVAFGNALLDYANVGRYRVKAVHLSWKLRSCFEILFKSVCKAISCKTRRIQSSLTVRIGEPYCSARVHHHIVDRVKSPAVEIVENYL